VEKSGVRRIVYRSAWASGNWPRAVAPRAWFLERGSPAGEFVTVQSRDELADPLLVDHWCRPHALLRADDSPRLCAAMLQIA
jgi:hypothetical protein